MLAFGQRIAAAPELAVATDRDYYVPIVEPVQAGTLTWWLVGFGLMRIEYAGASGAHENASAALLVSVHDELRTTPGLFEGLWSWHSSIDGPLFAPALAR